MKQIHCHTPHPSHSRDMGFARYFDTDASPHMQWKFDKESKSWRIEYLPKHYAPRGRVFWDSYRNGTIRRTSGKGAAKKSANRITKGKSKTK